MSSTSFKKIVWSYYKKNGRHDLPWRKTRVLYQILVSEVMLQQTQVERVVPYYKEFLKRFPTVRVLAGSSLADVLKVWQGLGYNRRAKMLLEAAKRIAKEHKSTFPRTVEELEELPGVGPYTARAVAAFAYNHDVIFIETNIRTAITHHFFAKRRKVSDAEILGVLEKLLPRDRSREWYSALMDYGAFLKHSGVKLNTKNSHYTRQSTFAGSLREARGAILRELTLGPQSKRGLLKVLPASRSLQLVAALSALQKEGLIKSRGRVFTLPQ